MEGGQVTSAVTMIHCTIHTATRHSNKKQLHTCQRGVMVYHQLEHRRGGREMETGVQRERVDE